MNREEEVKQRYERVATELNERTRRLLAASEALAIGWGGVSMVSRATGLSRPVISQGIKELQEGTKAGEGRIRRKGGGRKSNVSKDPSLSDDLERLVEPVTRGDPESPLRWTSKSVRKLAKELQGIGHQVSHELVSELLHELGYSLQALRKTREGGEHPDRDGQFEHLNAQAAAFLAAGEPAVSVDAKKKELVGDFKNPGREWHPQGEAEQVRVYDFPIAGLGRATPYGVYDLGRNAGWVNVGIDHDTAAFAVESIRRWWDRLGKKRYANKAKRLLITADCGGSNGARVRLWKVELQKLANETGLAITVTHHPPGTSKWNRIEHRMFSFISINWRGRPLLSHQVIVQLIASGRARSSPTTAPSSPAMRCWPGARTTPSTGTSSRPASRSRTPSWKASMAECATSS